jgi:hypothetical protein
MTTATLSKAQDNMTNFYGMSKADIKAKMPKEKSVLTGDYYMLSYDYDDLIWDFVFDTKTELCIAVVLVMPVSQLEFAKKKLSSEYPEKDETKLQWWSKTEMATIKTSESKKSILVSYHSLK